MAVHYTHPYLLNPTHRVSINLIGCGGTGSQVLACLARLNESLQGLGHPGIDVKVYDDDKVDATNVGRQLYSPADIGFNKAVISVTRINRFFGYRWQAVPHKYFGKHCEPANITITCVDSIQARVDVSKKLNPTRKPEPDKWQMYWMDFGNLHKIGQVVLGSVGEIDQSGSTSVKSLKNIFELFPQMIDQVEDVSEPSCSVAQALGKQDLFINSTLAQLGMNILWKLFREGRISNQGCFLNLDSMVVNPIKI